MLVSHNPINLREEGGQPDIMTKFELMGFNGTALTRTFDFAASTLGLSSSC